ncbi:hypothetical protein [Wenzhouxiangella sediminis]|uniref:hypothetical protein n=1 Tax=Wenzhouxiangella sediminis TaxID=1792836 RepID=UPI0011C070D2|nr:hypothetical protein [Wenzhouxiangella sediminis]
MKSCLPITVVALLTLAGCVHTPSPEGAPAPEPTLSGVTFSVSGEEKGAEECFVRYEVGYPEGIASTELALELETEMKRDDGSWLGIGWMEGIREQLPSPDAVGHPGGGGLLHYIHMEELLLACDQLRFRFIVHGCEPAPCPPLSADDRGEFEVLLDNRSQP